MNITTRTAQKAIFLAGSPLERNKGQYFLQIVAESGTLRVFEADTIMDEDGNQSVQTMALDTLDVLDPPEDTPRIWVSTEPPAADYHIWCRRSTGGDVKTEAARAYAQRDMLGLAQVAVLDIPSKTDTFHILVSSDGVLRTFMRETDLYAHMVDEIAGVL